MAVEIIIVGKLKTNCYLFYDEESGKVLIIDPGDDGEYIINRIKDLELKPLAILATHGHFDHVLAVTELMLAFKIPFYLHELDLRLLKRAQSTAQYFTGIKVDPPAKVDGLLKEGQIIKAGSLSLKVWKTPGHTPGGVSFYCQKDNCIFTGDTIFSDGGYGRTDFAGGDFKKLQASIKKILKLPLKTMIYSGHGQTTTVKNERKYYLELLNRKKQV